MKSFKWRLVTSYRNVVGTRKLSVVTSRFASVSAPARNTLPTSDNTHQLSQDEADLLTKSERPNVDNTISDLSDFRSWIR